MNRNSETADEQNPRKRRRSRFAPAPANPVPQRGVSGSNAALTSTSTQTPADVDLSAIPVAPVSTLKINQQVARTKKLKRTLKVLEDDLLQTDPSLNANFDPDIRVDVRTRRAPKRSFEFVQQGRISDAAEKARRDAERLAADALFREAMAARAAQAGSLPTLAPLAVDVLDDSRGGTYVPDIEWWDAPFVEKEASAASSSSPGPHAIMLREERVTHYIHQPVPILPSKATKGPVVAPLMLTEKERKRLRRQRRLEKETERREMIAVGLLPPPPPKVKLSNLMRVLAGEVTADPTKVEADVRAQVAERLRKHQADNEARRRTKDELQAKAAEKVEKDREAGLHVNVYRVLDVGNASHRFKVDMNARQLGLTGAFIVHADCNLVIVEGGSKGLRKYKTLLLRRVDWNANRAVEAGSDAVVNWCAVVFEGPIAQSSFDGFRTVTILTESSVRSFLRSRGAEGFLDVALATCLRDAAVATDGVA
jgi:U4/U6 small nuclear ribonucleoprotein PRP3